MTLKEFDKRFKRALARFGMRLCYWLVSHLPFWLVRGILNLLISGAFRLTTRLKRISRDSLRKAFGPEMTDERIEHIIKDCFKNIRLGVVELLYYSRYPDQVSETFSLAGQAHLDAALAKGKGAILVTAHFGNFPLMMLAMSRMGYKVNCILRRTRDEKVADIVLGIMNGVGVKTIYTHPRRTCVLESIRVLRNNEVLFILLDQHFGSAGGVFVDFFGRQAATATGPAVLGLRTGAPVVPVFCVRQQKNQHKIIFEPEVPLEARETEEVMIQENISRITAIIERYIRDYPHEWGWMHRRWKDS